MAQGDASITELRKWFSHDPDKWAEFKRRYAAESESKQVMLDSLREEAKKCTVTLLYGAKDKEHNQAVARRGLLEA